MTRGDIYLVRKPGLSDPRRRRSFVIVSRQVLIDSNYASMVCPPVYSSNAGLGSQVSAGAEEGLKHDSAVHCDGLVSLGKAVLTDYIGSFNDTKMRDLDAALQVALRIEEPLTGT